MFGIQSRFVEYVVVNRLVTPQAQIRVIALKVMDSVIEMVEELTFV